MNDSEEIARRKLLSMSRREGWMLVCAGLVLFLAMGQRHAFGLYLLPVSLEWGWNRETFSVALATQNLVWGLAQPFAGLLADRHGPRPVMIAGALCYGAGLALMPWSSTGWAMALSAGVLVGLGLSGTGFAVVYGAVGKAFEPARRPKALAVVGAVGGAGLFLMLPFNQMGLEAFGWAAMLTGLSVLMGALVPLAFGLGGAPAAGSGPEPQAFGPLLSQALRDRDFWLVCLGFLSCGFQLAFIATHLPAYLADQAQPVPVATLALGLVALANIAGNYCFGLWSARLRHKSLLALLYAARTATIAAFVLAPVSAWSVYAFALVFGFTWLGTVPLTTGLLGQLYGLRYVTTLFGLAFLSHQIGSFAGVWLAGWWYDRFGGYGGVWALALVLGAVSALANLPVRERVRAMRMARAA